MARTKQTQRGPTGGKALRPVWNVLIEKTEKDFGQIPVVAWDNLSKVNDTNGSDIIIDKQLHHYCDGKINSSISTLLLTALKQKFLQHRWMSPELYIPKESKKRKHYEYVNTATLEWEQKEFAQEFKERWERQYSDGLIYDRMMFRWLGLPTPQQQKEFSLSIQPFTTLPLPLLNIVYEYFYFQGRIEYWYSEEFEMIAMDLDDGAAAVVGTISAHPFIRSRIVTYDNSNGSAPTYCKQPWLATPNSLLELFARLVLLFCENRYHEPMMIVENEPEKE